MWTCFSVVPECGGVKKQTRAVVGCSLGERISDTRQKHQYFSECWKRFWSRLCLIWYRLTVLCCVHQEEEYLRQLMERRSRERYIQKERNELQKQLKVRVYAFSWHFCNWNRVVLRRQYTELPMGVSLLFNARSGSRDESSFGHFIPAFSVDNGGH